MSEPNAWASFTTMELIDSGMLTERSVESQLTEIAIIENELARRHGG